MSKRVGGSKISCSRQAPVKLVRGNHHELPDPSCQSKLGRFPCQHAARRTKVSLVCYLFKTTSIDKNDRTRLFSRKEKVTGEIASD